MGKPLRHLPPSSTPLAATETGLGDEILIASMVPDVLAAAKEVVLLCSERLVPLMRRSFPQARVELRPQGQGEQRKPLPTAAAAGDIADGVKRSSRFWLKRPFFQVVSGGAAHPDGAPSGGRRGWAYYQSQALAPDLLSNRAGFAELVIGPDAYAAQLHQRKRGRWRSAQVLVPRERPPHPAETVSPVLDPCLRCDPLTPKQ